MHYFVQVKGDENEESIEIPTETDGPLLLSSVEAQFPGAIGLKFRHPTSRWFRGVRLHEGSLHPPDEGWKFVFVCSFPKVKIQSHTILASGTPTLVQTSKVAMKPKVKGEQ